MFDYKGTFSYIPISLNLDAIFSCGFGPPSKVVLVV